MRRDGRRVFLALALGPEKGRELFEEILPSLGGAEAGRGFRLPRPEGLHLTLYFLGPRPGESLGPLRAAMQERCTHLRAARLLFDGTGCFPRKGSERVLWVGVQEEEGSQGRLAALREATLRALDDHGVDTSRERARTYRPHVTVARPRQFGQVPRGFHEARPAGGFSAPEVTLFESVRGQAAARYLPVWSIPLRKS